MKAPPPKQILELTGCVSLRLVPLTSFWSPCPGRMPMSQRVREVLIGLVCLLIGCLLAQQLPFGHAQPTKGPKWLHGLDLRARKGGEADFTKDTRKFGIEVFRDEDTNNLVYISETGSIAVVPARRNT